VLMEQLTIERSSVIALQKSAEGIVGGALVTEGQNKLWRVLVRKVILNGILAIMYGNSVRYEGVSHGKH